MFRLISTLLIFSCIQICVSFPPNAESSQESKSHEFITRYGIYSAVAKYLKLKEYVTGIFESDYKCIKEYFRSDSDGIERFKNVIDIIVKSNNNVQNERAGEAKISFNGEQIREGHNILVYLRGLIEKESKAEDPNVARIQEIIGQYMYTLQSFYSNSNWIDIKGVKPYVDLGIKNKELMDIASPIENTCNNSYSGQKHLGHCPNNIIEVNKLTSGYKSGQDVTKPQSTSFDKGKCSHGGPKDSTRSTTANCGINKETSDSVMSPHYDLHEHAAAAAIMATEHFISGDDTGLIYTLKDNLFKKVFGLTKWSAKSLAYAIDVSGSMGDDIAVVKSKTKEIILTLQNVPVDYVLVTFSDPEYLTTTYVTNDGSAMVTKLQSLIAFDGGDCPEYALSGIAAAITLSRFESDLFVFTDASPKDPERASEVIRLAREKKIAVTFLLTGRCSRRKRRSMQLLTDYTKRHKRQSGFGSVFDSIANATGGSVHQISSSNLSDVLESILKDSFPNVTLNQVNIDFLTKLENNTDPLEFNVDNGVTELQIKLLGVQTISDMDLYYPNGDIVNYRSNNNTWRLSSMNTIDITIPRPQTGKWSIITNLSSEIRTNISGQGSADFALKIMKQGTDGYIYDITGNPIAEKTVKLTADDEQTSLSTIALVDLTGTVILTLTLTAFSNSNDSRYTTNVIMPPMRFFFKINGSDGDGNIFTRIKWSIINPVQVQLILNPVYDALLLNQDYELHYQIKNLGGTNESFLASITDNLGFIVPPMSRNHTIASGSTVQDKFIYHPTTNPAGSILYTIHISPSESNEILQTISKYIHVTSVQHPTCKIVYVEGSCPVDEVTPNNCTQYKWFAITETTYSSISLSSVKLSDTDLNTQLFISNITAMHGPLATNVSGTCCLDIIDLQIVDTDGFLATCRLNFRESRKQSTIVSVVSDIKNSTTKGDDSDNLNVVAIAVGVSAAVVVVIFLIVFKCIVQHFGSSYKVKDHSILYSTPKATDKVMNVHYNPRALDETG